MISREEFDELFRLLPFYVNGTLAGADRQRMEAALAQSEELRTALAQERDVKANIVSSLDEVTEQSPEHATAREAMMKARISAAAPMAVAQENSTQKSGLGKALAFLNPKYWHPAVALGLAIALPAQAAVIASQSSKIAWLEDENYRLASGPCDDKQQAGTLLIEVNGDASFAEVVKLLAEEGLVIVESSDLGVLTVKTSGDAANAASKAQLERLRKSPLIASAEPSA